MDPKLNPLPETYYIHTFTNVYKTLSKQYVVMDVMDEGPNSPTNQTLKGHPKPLGQVLYVTRKSYGPFTAAMISGVRKVTTVGVHRVLRPG